MAIKYKWLTQRLRELIINYIQTGRNKLPAESELSEKYHVSRQTVRQALQVLEKEGIIEKKRGSGSYITGRFSDSEKNVVDILISSDSEYIYPALLADIHSIFFQNGFYDRVHVTHNDTCTERMILKNLLKHPSRGLLIEGSKSALPNPNLDLLHALSQKGCTIIFLHNYYPQMNHFPYIKNDNYGGSVLLTEYLLEQGHTSIGGIFKYDDLQGIERFQGFTETMHRHELSLPDQHISWFSSRELEALFLTGNTDFLKKIVQESLNSCTAVICYNDVIAYFLMKELPSNITVTSFDNSYMSNYETVSFTSLSHLPHEMGTKAAQMMLSRLKGLPVPSEELSWKLIPRKSSSPFSHSDIL